MVWETPLGVPHPILYAVLHVSNINLSNYLVPVYDFCHVGIFGGQCFPKNGCGTLEDCPDLADSLMDTSEFFVCRVLRKFSYMSDGTFTIPAGLIPAFMTGNCHRGYQQRNRRHPILFLWHGTILILFQFVLAGFTSDTQHLGCGGFTTFPHLRPHSARWLLVNQGWFICLVRPLSLDMLILIWSGYMNESSQMDWA